MFLYLMPNYYLFTNHAVLTYVLEIIRNKPKKLSATSECLLMSDEILSHFLEIPVVFYTPHNLYPVIICEKFYAAKTGSLF